MAPEMLHNTKEGYNAKIDIWSLGCIVLEMWTGSRAWNDEEIATVIYKVCALPNDASAAAYIKTFS